MIRIRRLFNRQRGLPARVTEGEAAQKLAERVRLAADYRRTHPPSAPLISGCCDRADF